MPIGNDVVDLRDPETDPGARHPRFDLRVFCPAELELLASTGDDRRRWMLWAAKESAYKQVVQRDPATVFSPVAFVVWLDGDHRATVTHGNRRLAVRFCCTDQRVHAVVYDRSDHPSPTWAVEQLTAPDDPSTMVRRLAVTTVARLLSIPAAGLEVAMERGVPLVRRSGSGLPVDLSLSHHGRFVACAVARINPRELRRSRPEPRRSRPATAR